jgi:hypothetical protein
VKPGKSGNKNPKEKGECDILQALFRFVINTKNKGKKIKIKVWQFLIVTSKKNSTTKLLAKYQLS